MNMPTVSQEYVIRVVFDAIDEVNEQIPHGQRLEKSVDTILFGQSGKLDSLGLVDLIVTTERKIEEEFGVTVALADERALSQKNSPFRTVASLAGYIVTLLTEKADAS